MNDTIGSGTPGQDACPPVDQLSYEQARDELLETVKILELGQMGLDESLKYWERGEALAELQDLYGLDEFITSLLVGELIYWRKSI